jgi:serine/threonine-protein kinase RsbW
MPVQTPQCSGLSIRSTPQDVRDALSCALGQLPLADLSADLRGTAELVLAEVLNNIVEHAHDGPDGKIHLTILRKLDALHCTLRDNGLALPAQTPPSGRLPQNDAQGYPAEGGYGWHLIRELTQNLVYRRVLDENWLTFELDVKQSA